MKVWNKVQLAIIIALLSIGAYVFASPYLIKKPGVVVVSISNSGCQNVHIGDIITEAGGNQIKASDDFGSLRFQPSQFVSLIVNSGPAGCIARSDGTLGIGARDMSSSTIIFGVDLVGGKKYNLDTNGIPQSMLQNITSILRTRTSYLGVADVKVQASQNSIELIAGKNTNVNQLLYQGYFEGSIQEGFVLKGGESSFEIGNNNYTIQKIGSNYLIDNSTRSLNDSFYLKDVKTTIVNETNSSVILGFRIFNNSDILGEVPGYSQVSYDNTNGVYSFNTLVSLSADAGKRFNDITQNIKTIVIGNQINLDAALVFNLDGNELSRLGLPANLKGQQINNLYIVISDPSQPSLLTKRALVEAAINGGSLPRQLTVSQTTNIDPSERNNILPSVGIILAAVIISPLVLGEKFKKVRHNVFSVVIGGAEIISVVSLIVFLQTVYKLNSSLDFPAVIGLVVLSVNWMINVISLNLNTHAQKELTLRIRYKKVISFNGISKLLLVVAAVVFGAYGYGVASMIVLFGVFLDLLLFRPFYKSFVS